MILQQKTNVTDVANIPASLAHSQGMFMKLVNYSSSDVRNILKTYTKFIFVRHPFERLLSAYRNKLEQHYESSKYFQRRYGRYIVKQYRPNASQEALIKGDDVSFKEFSSFLTDKNAVFNEHWKPINDLCQPCLIKYDIIGKYETLQQDAEFVLRHIGQSQIQFPKLPKPSSTMSRLQEYFGTLPRDMMQQLQNIYALDFDLFGYDTFKYNKPEFS
jgi:chondroitin 4-sulfotransferase 11